MDGHGSHLSDAFIAACAVARVYLCLLPAHSSHVTQPLDVSCFSSLKCWYRKFLAEYGYEDFTSAISNQNFIAAYTKARKEALSRRNILSGWRTTGLWPVDMARALESPFVIREAPETPRQQEKTMPKEARPLLTPQGGQELRTLLKKEESALAAGSHTTNLVVRKAAKALDIKNVEITLLQVEKRRLEQQIENLKPKKRKKVAPSVGQQFVMAAQITAVQQLTELTTAHEANGGAGDDIDIHGSIIDI